MSLAMTSSPTLFITWSRVKCQFTLQPKHIFISLSRNLSYLLRERASGKARIGISVQDYGRGHICRRARCSAEAEQKLTIQGMDNVENAGKPFAADNLKSEGLRETIRNLTEEDLHVAIDKYNIRDGLSENIDYAQISAFTDDPFGGNPAAVCYLPFEKDSKWMQLVARQFNLSETAFLVKRRSSPNVDNEFDLRWFTPEVEVDLCGHATLAAAHLVFTSGIVSNDFVLFHTRSGVLKAKRIKDEMQTSSGRVPKSKPQAEVGVVELEFPATVMEQCDSQDFEALSSMLGGKPVIWAGKTSLGDYLVELASANDVKNVQPAFQKMLDLEGRGGLIVTSTPDPHDNCDFISRFFCPKAGIPEDPVTGSAHCTLGPYWSDKLGKDTLQAYQASERGGRLTVSIDRARARVSLQGSAILVMVGVLLNQR